MDVDLSPYLNLLDEGEEPLIEIEEEAALHDRVFEEGSEVETVARLLQALTGLKMFLW